MTESRPRRAVTVVLSAITLLLLIGTAWVALLAAKLSCEVRQWTIEVRADIPVDLSKPGIIEIPNPDLAGAVCKHQILIRVDDPALASEPPDDVFSGLEAIMTITSTESEEPQVGPIDIRGLSYCQPVEPSLLLVRQFLGMASTPQASIRIEVLKGAPALAGINQRLVIRNELCGIESMLAALSRVIAGVLAFVAISFAAWTAARIVSHCKRPPLARPVN